MTRVLPAATGVLLALTCLGARAPRKGAEVLAAPPPVPVKRDAGLEPGSVAPVRITIGPYFGWKRSLTIANGTVEAVVVPAIGRVLQFRLAGQGSPFWEDPALRGQSPDPQSADWLNFGGDKSWPAPQADWPKQTPRAWPPPVGFDASPVDFAFRRDAIVLRSPVDPHYGIQVERVISLDHERPVMTIVTHYDKVEGDPVRVSVWIITQLSDPVAVFAPVPARSRFPEGYQRQSGDVLPADLAVEGGLLSLRRDRARSTKIGLDTDRLLWVGESQMLLVESPRVVGGDYPDEQSSAEIYTNPDPKAYVELETLGPLRDLRIGDRLSQTNTYSLHPRRHPDPATEARRLLSR